MTTEIEVKEAFERPTGKEIARLRRWAALLPKSEIARIVLKVLGTPARKVTAR